MRQYTERTERLENDVRGPYSVLSVKIKTGAFGDINTKNPSNKAIQGYSDEVSDDEVRGSTVTCPRAGLPAKIGERRTPLEVLLAPRWRAPVRLATVRLATTRSKALR